MKRFFLLSLIIHTLFFFSDIATSGNIYFKDVATSLSEEEEWDILDRNAFD